MKVAVIIPARMGASRFPGKPLVPILGIPLVEHVRRRTMFCETISQVIVATCDVEIKKTVEEYGGRVVMTSDIHERCTDRIAEAARKINADIIVNVQGDEPLVLPSMIDDVIKVLVNDSFLVCSNLMSPIIDNMEFENPNAVKVVMKVNKDMLYCSREPIPSRSKAGSFKIGKWKQLGIIAFTSDFLQTFCSLPPTPLEIIESVDMMRAVEHGYRVRMVETNGIMIGVDVPEDVQRVEAILANDHLLKKYV